MKNKTIGLLVILVLGLIMGCSGKGGNQPETTIDKGRVLKFLQGIQGGDKKMMYEASNLTEEMVSDSREKLIYAKQYQQTGLQRRASEHALRISGQIDFFLMKTRPMFPKSASFLIMEAKAQDAPDGDRHAVYLVKISYADKAFAMRDKTGKLVKEMVFHLQQLTRVVGSRPVHEFSFAPRDFAKIAAKDFEVLSYF